MLTRWPKPDVAVFSCMLLLWGFLVVGFIQSSQLLSPQFGYSPAGPEEAAYGTLDFPTLFHFVRGTLQGLAEHPYRVASMPALLEPWVGEQKAVMPFISPPTAMLSMGPFTLLAPGVAWALWSGLSVVVASCVMTICRRELSPVSLWVLPLFWLLAVNANSFVVLLHGQTTWMSNAVLMLIFYAVGPRSSRWMLWVLAALVTALTGKPQVALVALIFILATRQWSLLVRVVLLTAGTCLVLTPFYGVSWPVDYLTLVTSYGTDTAASTVSRQIGPEVMTNLRGFLYPYTQFSDGAVSRWSWIFFAVCGGATILAGWKHALHPRSLFAAASLSYLLFCPHLNGYEDLLLLPALALWLPGMSLRSFERIGLIFIAAVILNTSMGWRSWFEELQQFNHVFVLKLVLVLWMAGLKWAARKRRESSD